MLVQHLPLDSAAAREHRGHTWTDINFQLADLFDRVGALVAVTVAANSKDGKVKQPDPFPRPDKIREKADRRELSSVSALTYIEQYRQRREG